MKELCVNLGNNAILSYGKDEYLLEVITDKKKRYALSLPVFEISGKEYRENEFRFVSIEDERHLNNGGKEITVLYKSGELLDLYVQLRVFPNSPVIKYRYKLSSSDSVILTKNKGKDAICYTSINIDKNINNCAELQFAEFNPIVHSYHPFLHTINTNIEKQQISVVGPIVLACSDTDCILMAYEHGAEYPDGYLEFEIKNSSGLSIMLLAKKGNYYSGQKVTAENPFLTCWFEFAVCEGNMEDMFRYYREFILKYISLHNTSRAPYIYYNTWNNQERNRNFKNESYLSAMNEEHMLKEIEVAHQLGIDVFVLDTGWYQKTGDWEVDSNRFPRGLAPIYEKLNSYGMKLGLWLNPIAVAKTSKIFLEHPEYVIEEHNGFRNLGKIWETEESYEVCLASGYSDYLIQVMVNMYHKMGVSYFKWDAVGQYGCQSTKHHHGGENNPVQERLDCYSYQMGLSMIHVVEEVALLCPDVIVDYDITEEKRFVGLGYLSVGKYFHVNNGPYAKDFELPQNLRLFGNEREVFMEPFMNIFSFPGVMRSKICRQSLLYDFFIPSELFLAHFFPDGPIVARNNAMTSMTLGGNGIWGDLLGLSVKEINEISGFIKSYKKVAKAVVESYPVNTGSIGSNLETYEKIDYKSGNGMIGIFTRWSGTYSYLTQPIDPDIKVNIIGTNVWERKENGSIQISISTSDNDARSIFIMA